MAPIGKFPPVPVTIEDEMRTSYMDYAMSVIVGRALPDVRDGLKPVHRRVLYAMSELGNEWNKPPKKSARVVGDVIGKFHPHGDTAVYDTIVRMAQDFSLRYPLISGQGNFGSVDGDRPAAMRYTEVRLARIAADMLADIDKETVEFVPNYDETTHEPAVLPARLPNLLVNGSAGIAVGMATNIPPHNLGEICDALLAVMDDPDIKIEKLLRIVKGPDFPTGGIIYGRQPIVDAYKTGRGVLTVRARANTETEERTGRTRIVVTEIPYQLNKTRLIEKIAELVNDKKLDGISDLRDESDREGMRIVIELKRDAVPLVVLNNLYKQTPMQDSFGIIMLALVGGRPRLLNLKQMLEEFIAHRKEIITRATVFDLRKAEARLHLLEGLKIALDNLDAVIKLIRGSKDTPTAKDGLMKSFGLSDIQAQAILDMRLQRLTGLERDKILEEYRETQKVIERLRQILADEREVVKIIATDLETLRKQYGDERRTQIEDATGEITIEDMIVEEEMVVTVSHEGYIKRNAVSLYRAQRRGGRGKVGATTKGEDFVEHMFTASTHDYVLFFTNRGRVYWKKVHELPQAGRAARGKAIVNLLQLAPGEQLSTFLPVRDFSEDTFVLFATAKGIVKKTPLLEYSRPRASGIIAINLTDGDELIAARLTAGDDQVALATRSGQLARFNESEVRPMGRGAGGVRGVNVDEDDRVVAMEIVRPGATLLTVSANGMGKRSPVDDYRLIHRGGSGVKTMNLTPKTGPVVGVLQILSDEDEVMIVTSDGKMIRIAMENVRIMSRNTQGVTLVKLDVEAGEHVVSVAPVAEKESGGDEE
ncbi:MAG TPA: DNA gyrase subunit A [Candidatus Limnocylindrales bacterium]|nr:DNA gyrase subunit A [Candidatus Limnocylindrales bacterium]